MKHNWVEIPQTTRPDLRMRPPNLRDWQALQARYRKIYVSVGLEATENVEDRDALLTKLVNESLEISLVGPEISKYTKTPEGLSLLLSLTLESKESEADNAEYKKLTEEEIFDILTGDVTDKSAIILFMGGSLPQPKKPAAPTKGKGNRGGKKKGPVK